MKNSEYILNQEIKNRRILLKMYERQAFKIKKQLYEAYFDKRSTHYLESLLANIEKEISTLDKFFKEYAKRQTKESYLNGVKQADYQIKQLTLTEGITVSAFAFGTANREAVKLLAKETYIPLNKLTKTLARDCREYLKRENFESTEKALKSLGRLVDSKTLRKLGIEGVADVVVGNRTWQQAMRSIRSEIIDKGVLTVPYYNKKGDLFRKVAVQEYTKMVARTTTAKIMREGTKNRIMEVFGDEGDLVQVIGHSQFPDSPCLPYENKILSLAGNTSQDIIDKLGDLYAGTLDEAEANGLFHPNCVHTFGVTDKIMAVYGYTPEEK